MAARGADTIFTAPVLIVRQKTKLIEVSNEYTILDQQGESIADVRQVGQGLAKKTLRFLGTPADRLLTFKLRVGDRDGNVLLMLTRPAKLVKSRLVVHDGEGTTWGRSSRRTPLAGSPSRCTPAAKNWARWWGTGRHRSSLSRTATAPISLTSATHSTA
jgi:hypothetical protein